MMHRNEQAASSSPSLSYTPETPRGLKRTRTMHWIAIAGLALLPTARALSSVTTPARKTRAPRTLPGLSDAVIARRTPRVSSPEPVLRYVHDDDDEDEDGYDEDYEESETLESSVASFQRLRESTGSEILQSGLQKQIDESISRPNQFLDKYASDASPMERVAMASITEQLPQRAVEALTKTKKKTTTTNKEYKSSLNFAGTRVSREQEIHLARIIQQGVVLHNVRTQAEAAGDKSLTRQEWADLAGLSPTELRRQVIDYRKAKQELVTANLGLVHAVVNHQWPIYHKLGVTKEELVQEGSLGLMRAAELFDPERGLRFSTYATIWTKGVLSNSHLTELVRLPQREKTKWNKIVRAHKDLEENGAKATVQELAAATGMTVEEVLETQIKMSQAQRVLSLDYEYNTQSRSGTQSTSINTVQNDKAFQEDVNLAEKTRMQADVVAAMARNLDAREARLMRLRYGLSDGQPRSLAECADAMGLSHTRVQQLSQQCLKKLRSASEAKSLEEYLLTIA
jgi:RNA polymerase sigma factor (sigma-70 family)